MANEHLTRNTRNIQLVLPKFLAVIAFRHTHSPPVCLGYEVSRYNRVAARQTLREANSSDLNLRKLRGFTMVELIAVMLIAGILAAVALPRFFDRNAFDSRGFYGQVISTLRYAQKAAIAQNRFVCVAFTTSKVTLTTGTDELCTTNSGGSTNLVGPTGDTPYVVNAPSGVALSGYTTPIYFDALGVPSASQSITVSGFATAITIETETGYVY